MVSNFGRILDEIRREAIRAAPAYGLQSEPVVKLIMDIVNLEDQHRVKAMAGIHQRVRGMIEDAARPSGSKEDA